MLTTLAGPKSGAPASATSTASMVGNLMRQWDLAPAKALARPCRRDRFSAPAARRRSSGLGLDREGASPRLARQKIGDAAGSVAAGAGEGPVVVIDERVGKRFRRTRVAQNHHLIVVETFCAMNGARFLRRGRRGAAAQVEDQDLVAGPVHAREFFGRRAGSQEWRGLLIVAEVVDLGGRGQPTRGYNWPLPLAFRVVDDARAEPHDSFA